MTLYKRQNIDDCGFDPKYFNKPILLALYKEVMKLTKINIFRHKDDIFIVLLYNRYSFEQLLFFFNKFSCKNLILH